jgi:hypothetical protein
MNRRELLITFDYELFLGRRSGTVDDCMLVPTRKLMEIMGEFKIRSVFFVDTTYLLRLKEMAQMHTQCGHDLRRISDQIRDLVTAGHYVFPHIHPHWLDAVYEADSNQWSLSNISKYRFHHISPDQREQLFTGSIRLLEEIIHPVKPGYEVNGYRAGGWCIQPFEDFLPLFRKHRMKYEFSIMGGFYQFTEAQQFDFSNAPDKDVYCFADDVCKENDQGEFTAFRISSTEIDSFTRLLEKLWIKILYRFAGDHTFARGEGQTSRLLTGKNPVNSSGINMDTPGRERISIELLNRIKLGAYLRYLEHNVHMHFLSHPKMINDHSMTIFRNFLKTVYKKYDVVTDFKLMIPATNLTPATNSHASL